MASGREALGQLRRPGRHPTSLWVSSNLTKPETPRSVLRLPDISLGKRKPPRILFARQILGCSSAEHFSQTPFPLFNSLDTSPEFTPGHISSHISITAAPVSGQGHFHLPEPKASSGVLFSAPLLSASGVTQITGALGLIWSQPRPSSRACKSTLVVIQWPFN